MPQRKFRSASLLLIPVLIGSLLLSACGDDSNTRVLTLPSPNPSQSSAATTAASTTAPGATTASATTPADVGATATPAIVSTPSATTARATTARATTAPAPTATPRATPTPRPTITPPQGLPGKLALLGPDNALYIQKFDGSKPVVALGNPAAPPSQTQDGIVAEWPTWSKDGSKLAAIGLNIKSGQVDTSDVIVTEGDGKNPVKVAEGAATPPVFISWSPDGNQLSLLVKGTGTTAPLELRLVDTKTLAAKPTQRKVAEGAAVYTGWSPDSQQLLIHTSTSATDSALALLSAKDTSAQPAALKVTPSLFRSPAFSSEGSRLAFAVTNITSGNEDIYVQDKTGKDFGKLDSGGKGVNFSWSPADPRLAFSSVLAGSQGLYKGISMLEVDLKATAAATLTATQLVTDDVAAFFWSPDGKKLAYVTLNDAGDMLVWKVYDLDTKKTTNLAEWFPSDIWGQLISFFDQYAQSNSIWSPDSKALVFAGLSKEDFAAATSSAAGQNLSPEVYVLPVDGANAGKAQAVGYGSLAFWSK